MGPWQIQEKEVSSAEYIAHMAGRLGRLNNRHGPTYTYTPESGTQLMLYTHVGGAWSVVAWPKDQSVSLAIHSECSTKPSRLRTAESMLYVRNVSTCQAAMHACHRHTQNHGHRSQRTPLSALPPASLLVDRWTSIQQHQWQHFSQWVVWFNLGFKYDHPVEKNFWHMIF